MKIRYGIAVAILAAMLLSAPFLGKKPRGLDECREIAATVPASQLVAEGWTFEECLDAFK